MKNTYSNRFKIYRLKSINPYFNSGHNTLKSNILLFFLAVTASFSTIQGQCGSEPFPNQWSVHQLQSSELPYRSVYIYANTDIDGDGKKDIVTGGWWYKNPGSASGNWVQNTIGGSFKNMAYIHDFDGDGDPDLLGTTGDYTGADLVWAQNNGSGSFTIRTNIPSGDTNYSEPFLAGIAGANFQSGGPFQMAINWNGAESTDSPVQMLTVPSDPVNTTWPLVDISSSSLGEDLQAGDIDDDGDLDLFQSKNWLRNNGDGSWSTINTGIDYVTTPDRAQLADFDGDGDLDAVVGQLGLSSNPASTQLAWFEAPSNPANNWTRHILATDINGSLSVYAEDIDQDGDDDIVVGEWKGSNRLIAFENDLCDTGTWIRHTLNAGGTGFDHHDGARVVDIDDDGDFDVVSIGWDNIVPRIFENTSTTSNNQDPVANAGSNQTITLPTNSITINGSGSDPDGGNVEFAWTQTSGPNTATLSNEDTDDLTASNLVEGTYVFRLTVTDDENETVFDEMSVTVNPEANTDLPVANAGADQNIILPTNSITLNGSGNDPDGGNVTFLWSQTSGPNTATLSNEDTADLTAANLVEGIYVFRLTLTDDENDTAFDEMSVTVSPEANTDPPVANAGADQNITLPTNSITINGSGNDPDGGNVTFLWSQTSGSNTATLSDESTNNLTASDLIEGTYVFRLTVTDDENDTAFDEMTVTVSSEVNSDLPLVNAGSDQNITLPTNSITINGSGSDPDGGNVTFAWTQTSGPNTATLSDENTSGLIANGLIEGMYVFRLTVTDDENDTAFDEMTVTVSPEVNSDLPLADAGSDQNITLPTNSITISGSGSDPDGGNVTFLWSQTSGPNTATLFNDITPDLTANDLIEGNYVFRLTVTDDENETSFDEVSVIVLPEGSTNQPPVAIAAASPLSGEAPLEVQFEGSASTDDLEITTYSWDFRDGETSSDANPTYTFNTVGVYTIELTVADADGLTNQTSITITVIDPESVPEETGVILEENPSKEGIARIRLMNQPENIQITELRLHDMIGRFVEEYAVQGVNTGNGAYEIPVSKLRDGPYYLGIVLSDGTREAIVLVVRN